MRRWFLFLFVCLLPLQSAWSAASAYCQHETSPAQREHVGHHAHVHAGEVKTTSADGQLSTDPDCGSCHASGATALPAQAARTDAAAASMPARAAPSPSFDSAPARAPDRPQWPRLV